MFNSAFLNTIVLLGALQGFILAALLFFTPRNRQANRLLAALVFFIGLACLNLFLIHQDGYESTDTLRVIAAIVPMIIIMPLGPLVYFYVRTSIDPAFRLTKKHRLYFYPVIIDLVPQLTAGAYILALTTGIINQNANAGNWLGHFIDTYNVYSDIPRWLSLTGYLVLSARLIRSSGQSARPGLAAIPSLPAIKWLRQFIYVFLVFQFVWLIHLVPYLLPRYSNALLDWGDWYPVYVPLVIIIYWLGIKGWLLARDQPAARTAAPILPEATIREAILLLKKSMEQDRLYLDPALNLALLAKHTGLPAKTISAVLNRELVKSFSEFINEYRVSEIKRRLLLPGSENLTIAGLAYECGFNSQPTFQRAFKSIVGLTPKEFVLKNA